MIARVFKRILACSAAGGILLLTGCADSKTVTPGRGVEREVGTMARVYPSGEASRVDRHGLWRGMTGDQVVWEVRYTRGVPTGPYRQWDENGNLQATWPYNWEGEIVGWARWYENGEPTTKFELTEDLQPEGDVIGRADVFEAWVLQQPAEEKSSETP